MPHAENGFRHSKGVDVNMEHLACILDHDVVIRSLELIGVWVRVRERVRIRVKVRVVVKLGVKV